MKKLLLSLLLLLAAFVCSAQNWSWLNNIGFMNLNPQPMQAGYNNDMFGIFSKHDSTYIPEADCYVNTGMSGTKYLVRYASDGSLHWQKKFQVHGLAVSSSNDVATIGYFSDYVTLGDTMLQGDGTYRSFIAWINDSGHLTAVDVQNEGNTCSLVKADRAGNIYVSGDVIDTIKVNGQHIVNASGEPKKYIIKLSPQRQILSSVLFEASIKQVSIDLNNNVTIAGMFNDSLIVNDSLLMIAQPYFNSYVLRLNSNGGIVWCKPVYGAYLSEMDCDVYNNMYVMGKFYNGLTVDNVTLYDTTCGPNQCGEAFVIKLDEDGTLEWVTRSGRSMLNDEVNDFAVAPSGNVYFTGELIDFQMIGSDSITPNANNTNNWDPYLACLSPNGSLNWYESPYNISTGPNSVAIGNNGDLYWAGTCEMLALGSDTVQQICENNQTFTFYLAHMVDASAVNIPAVPAGNTDILVYPNPSGDVFNIRYSGLSGNCMLNIYNQLGQKVHSVSLDKEGEGTYTLGRDLVPGVYILQLEEQRQAALTRKLVKCR